VSSLGQARRYGAAARARSDDDVIGIGTL
jgi:hypothetical protein